MAEQKTTAGAKAPARRRASVAKTLDASETVTSKAPTPTKSARVKTRRASVAKASDAAATVTSKAPAQAKSAKVETTGPKTSKGSRSEAAVSNTRKVSAAKTRSAARTGAARKAGGPATAATALTASLLGFATRTDAGVSTDQVVATGAAAPARGEIQSATAALGGAGPEHLMQAYSRFRSTKATLQNVVSETAMAAGGSVLEVNGKVIDAMRAQSDAAFDLWRSTLSARSLSEAVRLQTSGARQAYETAANHWKDMAETTTRLFSASIKPIQSALTNRFR